MVVTLQIGLTESYSILDNSCNPATGCTINEGLEMAFFQENAFLCRKFQIGKASTVTIYN